MFYSGVLTEGSRKDMDLREAAALRQQRRMKQAVQFIHKDSADLLPLDGLKKLGSSKEMQPHSILQRRLLETNLSRFRLNNRGPKPANNGIVVQSNGIHHSKQESLITQEEEDLIFVSCKCSGREIKVLIDTGCKFNLISAACLDRLGLKEAVNMNKMETDTLLFPRNLQVLGQIEKMSLTIGQVKADCSVLVVESDRQFMSLGNRTLRSLKCVIDTEKQFLVLGRTEREQVEFIDGKSMSREESSPGV
ncbi:nuclear receptor-interacting protein 3 [Amia ocellicauda]|uniref:nuclear receptor-interacting protein 3 n=1 Tax=Amia ocellicauda TaxID=2972642 RepID=UPI00346389E3